MPRQSESPRKRSGAQSSRAATPLQAYEGPDLASGLRATDYLLASVATGDPPQNALLVAAPGSGKRAVALRYATALLCIGTDGVTEVPCGQCRACRLATAESHPDLHIAPVPLRVEGVRDIISRLALSPTESTRRLALVADVDLASPSAANALLKTLEEPPPHAILILTAGNAAQVLPTILSRARVVPVGRRSVADMTARLVEAGVEPGRADLAARLSDGRLGWAWQAASGTFDVERVRWLDELTGLLRADLVGRLERAARLAKGNDDLESGMSTWRSWARDVLYASAGTPASIVAADREAEVIEVADRIGLRGALELTRAIDTAITHIAANANKQLALEGLVLAMPA